jgi:hypothetical protein
VNNAVRLPAVNSISLLETEQLEFALGEGLRPDCCLFQLASELPDHSSSFRLGTGQERVFVP